MDIFIYEFQPWPDVGFGFPVEVYDLFKHFSRCEKVFKENDFEHFRSRLSHAGITLREVTRMPYTLPESVL